MLLLVVMIVGKQFSILLSINANTVRKLKSLSATPMLLLVPKSSSTSKSQVKSGDKILSSLVSLPLNVLRSLRQSISKDARPVDVLRLWHTNRRSKAQAIWLLPTPALPQSNKPCSGFFVSTSAIRRFEMFRIWADLNSGGTLRSISLRQWLALAFLSNLNGRSEFTLLLGVVSAGCGFSARFFAILAKTS